MPVPLIDQVKLQSQILIPLVKALQSELGEDRANAIIRKALGDLYRKYGESWWQQQGEASFGQKMSKTFQMFAEGDALKYEVVKETPQAYEVNVTACKYAEFYKKLGVPERGFLLTCSADFDHAAGFGGDVELTRKQTIMQGASHCDFRYALKKSK